MPHVLLMDKAHFLTYVKSRTDGLQTNEGLRYGQRSFEVISLVGIVAVTKVFQDEGIEGVPSTKNEVAF